MTCLAHLERLGASKTLYLSDLSTYVLSHLLKQHRETFPHSRQSGQVSCLEAGQARRHWRAGWWGGEVSGATNSEGVPSTPTQEGTGGNIFSPSELRVVSLPCYCCCCYWRWWCCGLMILRRFTSSREQLP
ncbi:hypothetical protein O3P69_008428 [Scylla paramamosain]|uniref:Uncharacterized protein n=1 Tax=Scylla paramamosain TaxID=85552 RepID=A0AAW0SKK8_SCYPA